MTPIELNFDGIEPERADQPVALGHAIRYAVANGWRCFPCEPRGKRPLVKWRDEATTDPAKLREWWVEWPDANVAICTGDGLVVVDVDGPDGARTAELLKAQLGGLPETLTAVTGKGRHHYLRADGVDVRNSVSKLGPGVDIRAEGGYVIAPPSTHPSGARYSWEHAASDVGRLPDAWAAKMAAPNRTDAAERTEATHADTFDVPAGQRNDYLWRMASRLRRTGLARGAIVAAMHAENQARCKPPGSAKSVEDMANRVMAYTADDPVISEIRSNGDGTLTIVGSDRGVPIAPEHDDMPEDAAPEVDVVDGMLPLETWGEFRDAADDDVAFLVRGLWPAGAFGFIAGPPKARKTWVALDLAISLASGTPFVGHDTFDLDGVPVLYVALEGARSALKHRIGAIARGKGLDPDAGDLAKLHFVYKPPGLNLAAPAWAEALRVQAERLDAQLVVVDVLRAAATIKENDASDFAALRTNLSGITSGDGRSLAILHHFGKLSETTKERSAAERMSGSGAMHGALDVGLFLVTPGGSDQTTMEVVCRDLAAPDAVTFAITGDGSGPNGGYIYRDACRLDAVEPDSITVDPDTAKPTKAQSRTLDLAQRVAEYVETHGTATPAQIYADVPGATKNSLRTIKDNGMLARLGVGYAGEGNDAHYRWVG